MATLTTEEQAALTQLTRAVEAVLKLSPTTRGMLCDYVADNGSDSDEGARVDRAVEDCLDVLSTVI